MSDSNIYETDGDTFNAITASFIFGVIVFCMVAVVVTVGLFRVLGTIALMVAVTALGYPIVWLVENKL